jgi:hypothetical protein
LRAGDELCHAILDAIDHYGYLPTWGWNRRVPKSKKYTRKQRSRAMSLLIADGVVEARQAIFKDVARRIYTRSENYSKKLAPLNKEMAEYRLQHLWWVPSGTIIIPESYLSKQKRRGDHPASGTSQMYHSVEQRPSPTGENDPKNGAFAGDAEYPTLRGAGSRKKVPKAILEEISDLMEISQEEADIFVLDLVEGYMRAMSRRITAEMAARQYLRHRHDDFSLWD